MDLVVEDRAEDERLVRDLAQVRRHVHPDNEVPEENEGNVPIFSTYSLTALLYLQQMALLGFLLPPYAAG